MKKDEVQISIWIPRILRDKVHENRWKYGEIFLTGCKAKVENPHLLERIADLEKGNSKLQDFCTRLNNKITLLGDKN